MTIQYTVHQVTYWAAAAGVVSFATAFLLGKGFAPATVGAMLAAGNLLSCAASRCWPTLPTARAAMYSNG